MYFVQLCMQFLQLSLLNYELISVHFRKNVSIRDVIALIYREMFSCAVSKSVVVHTSLTNKILLFPLNAIDLLI